MSSVKQGKWGRKNPLVKHKNPKVLKKFALALAIVLTATALYVKALEPHTLEAKQVRKLQSTEQQLNQTKKQLEKQQTSSQADEKAKEQQIQQLNQQLQDAQKQLQARAAARASATAYAAETPVGYTVTDGCGDNEYAHYIYMHESGCRTNAIGGIETALGRACGIGQALPCSKLPCALDDYACENSYFTNYAVSRYGSWYNAYVYWIDHGNW
jgi:DNA-binding transcriptional MerR regulator